MSRKFQDTIEITVDEKAISEDSMYGRSGRRTYLKPEAKSLKEIIAGLMLQRVMKKNLPDGYQDMRWEVHLWFSFADQRRRDLQNYEKLIFDALTDILWKDDDYTHIPRHYTSYDPTPENQIRIKCLLYENN